MATISRTVAEQMLGRKVCSLVAASSSSSFSSRSAAAGPSRLTHTAAAAVDQISTCPGRRSDFNEGSSRRRFSSTASRRLHKDVAESVRPSQQRSAKSGRGQWAVSAIAAAGAALWLVHQSRDTVSLDDSATKWTSKPPPKLASSAPADGGLISMSEVEEHDSPDKGLWVVIDNYVYDITDFLESHPGGQSVILKNAGKDVTEIYQPIHPSNAIKDNLNPEAYVGPVDPSTVVKVEKKETEAEKRKRIARENLPPVGAMINLDDFQRVAQEILSDQAWAYYSSAADDEITVNENRNAYGRVWFKPRILRKVGTIDTSAIVCADTVPVSIPVYVSPAAMAKLGHPDGEINLTRAAHTGKIIQGVSANASVSLDDILDARADESQPIIYQLYVNRDRAASERILKNVQDRGCKAVMLTVDAPVMGKRERDMRAKGEVVSTGGGMGGNTHGGGVASAISGYIDPDLQWSDIAWYREHCKLPLFLKGVQTVDDAALAAENGVHGIVLSNHGGRSLDFARPPLDVLIDIRQQRPDLFSKLEIWIDGGVRRGTDVVKALCLGASAVGLGRPFLYAQSGFGQKGAERAIEIVKEEVERTMRFLGVTRIQDLGPEQVEILPRVYASTMPPHSARGSVPAVD